jgi:Holliday junction DNA helicase RuvA
MSAISSGDTASLVRVPGIGNKTAQRIVLELKDKMTLLVREHQAIPESNIKVSILVDDVIEAFINWGYSRVEAKKAAEAALREHGDQTDITEVVTTALQKLMKR